MTFREKIDKILKANRLEINSVYGLEVYIGAAPGAINKYYKKDSEPGAGTIKKILDGLSVNTDWWETGRGEIFNEKPTPAIKSDQPDVLDNPLVKSYIARIATLEDYNGFLKRENEELRAGKK